MHQPRLRRKDASAAYPNSPFNLGTLTQAARKGGLCAFTNTNIDPVVL
jgi:hypothetical protein